MLRSLHLRTWWDNRKMKKAIAVAIISTFMVVLSLYAVNAIIAEQQKNRQREISHTLLSYSEELTQISPVRLKIPPRRDAIAPV